MNNQSGFSLIETLVSMVILGLLVTFTIMFFNNIYSNPKLLLRSEALLLADVEISKCMNFKLASDTSYINLNGNLEVIRNVIREERLLKVAITVRAKSNKKEILKLETSYLE